MKSITLIFEPGAGAQTFPKHTVRFNPSQSPICPSVGDEYVDRQGAVRRIVRRTYRFEADDVYIQFTCE